MRRNTICSNTLDGRQLQTIDLADRQDSIRQYWYVAAAQPHRETFAQLNLQRQGISTFVPMRRKTIRRSRRFVEVAAPLFPGYLFISIDPKPETVRAVNGTRGVKNLLQFSGRPAHLPGGFVETLKLNLEDEGTVSMRGFLHCGDKVEIASGPFARQVGELMSMDDRGRVRVLLQLLSMQVEVSTRAGNLLPA
jgi:transcription elongation factor/antiterminator RfaH